MWSNGRIFTIETKVGFEYWAKHYDEPSQYGIDAGRISKLTIKRLSDGKTVYNFDRGLDLDNLDADGKAAYAIILEKYN